LKRCGAPKRRPGDRRESADASAGRESQLLGDELPVAVLWLTDRNVLVKRQTRAVAGQDFRISRDKSN
jgi:hypothetical protein